MTAKAMGIVNWRPDAAPPQPKPLEEAADPGAAQASRFQLLFDSNPSPVMVINRDSLQFIDVNAAALDFYGYTKDEFLALCLPDIRPELNAGDIEGMIKRFGDPTLPDVPRLHLTKAGERKIVRVSARTLDFDGVPAILATIFDMTRQQMMEDEVHRARAFLKSVVDRVPTALYAKDAATGQFIFCNSMAEQVFGLTRDQVVGRTTEQIFPPEEAARLLQQDARARQAGPAGIADEGIYIGRDGKKRRLHLKKVLISDGGPDARQYFLGVAEDVTEARLREAEIAHLASHDVLTGLPNRWLFHTRLHDAQKVDGHEDTCMAIHYIDLDGFKAVNDTLGHATGDLLLKCVAERMSQIVRRKDVVARFGGDEFAVLQTTVQHAREATCLAERLVHSLSEPYELNGHLCHVSASIGVAVAALRSPAERLIEQADAALYAAKRGGRKRFVLHPVDGETSGGS